MRILSFLIATLCCTAALDCVAGADQFSAALIATQRTQDAETAAGLLSNGELLYREDPNKRSWGRYCGESQNLSENGDFRLAVRAASKALYLGTRDSNLTARAYASRDLAYAYSFAGDLVKARSWANESLSAVRLLNDPRSTSANDVVAPVEKILGEVEARLGNHDAALKHFETALDAANWGASINIGIRLSIAMTEMRRGNLAKARKLLAAEVRASDANYAAIAQRGLGLVAMAEGDRDLAATEFRKATASAHAAKDVYSEMWAHYGLASALSASGDRDAAIGEANIALDQAEQLRARFRAVEFKAGFFGDVQQIFDFAISLALDMGSAERALEYSERSRARAALDMLRERSRSAGKTGDATTARKPAEIISSLPEKTVVVAYHVLPARVVAWTLRRDGIAVHALPVKEETLTASTRALRESITSLDTSFTARSEALYRDLIAPLALHASETVVAVPHKILHVLPLHALKGTQGYLIETNPVAYALSLSAISETLSRPAIATGPLLALGNPDLSNPAFDLPAAEREVTEIAKILGGGTPYIRKDASGDRFRTQAVSSGIIHVASHATVDGIDPLYSVLKLAAATGRGDVEAREVYDMNLAQAQLVTLSACDSGLGHVSTGDEFWGFKRSFLIAGANSLMVSLWPVADGSTELLMRTFYQRRNNSSGVEALRLAQLELLKSSNTSAPLFWAPFVLVGDWR